jgi:hypothetical protein
MTNDAPRRLAALGLACAAVAGFAACGSSNQDSSGSSATTASSQSAGSGGSALSAGDARTLADARAAIANQCKDKAAVTGAVATLESLYEIDPEATDAKGTSVRAAVTDATAQLRSCNRAAAKRLAKLAR